MFFYLSKIFWFFASPGNLMFIFIATGTVLLWLKWRRSGTFLVSVGAVALLLFAILPFREWMMLPLENRFPVVHQLPKKVDGIIALGGVVNPAITKARGQITMGGAVERLTEFARLARHFPDAKLVFTGGSGDLFRQDVKEGDLLDPLLDTLGLDKRRVLVENQSRNTVENATLTRQLAKPKPGEVWLLITSAFHMPRTVGVFRQAGWKIVPYPVDYNLEGEAKSSLSFNVLSGMYGIEAGLHEWLGLIFYRLTGKTDALFPGPDD